MQEGHLYIPDLRPIF